MQQELNAGIAAARALAVASIGELFTASVENSLNDVSGKLSHESKFMLAQLPGVLIDTAMALMENGVLPFETWAAALVHWAEFAGLQAVEHEAMTREQYIEQIDQLINELEEMRQQHEAGAKGDASAAPVIEM